MILKASEAAVIAERRLEKITKLTKDAVSIYAFLKASRNIDDLFDSFEIAYGEFKKLLKESLKDIDSENKE